MWEMAALKYKKWIMDKVTAAGIRWDFEGKYRRMDETVDTSVYDINAPHLKAEN